MQNDFQLIGWDCAVDARKNGIAFGHYRAEKLVLEQAFTGLDQADLLQRLQDRLKQTPQLLCIDAPLGWPRAMGNVLADQQAGEAIEIEPHELFRRHTDRFIHRQIGKLPLDVGADRIARCALATLQRLGQLREHTGLALPLGWQTPDKVSIAIEVYPAGTLTVYGLRSSGYKGNDNRPKREQLLASLTTLIEIPDDLMALLAANDDVLDAVICLLAGKDFIQGNVYYPEDLAQAKKEGWIWVGDRAP